VRPDDCLLPFISRRPVDRRLLSLLRFARGKSVSALRLGCNPE
jgi:hypothetical protein